MIGVCARTAIALLITAMSLPVETFFLPTDGQGTKQARIQQMIAQGILLGRFVPGDKLPSTRKLAARLNVSRITVTLAYTELQANDYLSAKGRSGYYVSDNAPVPPRYPRPNDTKSDRVDWDRAIAQRYCGGPVLSKPQDWAQFRYPFIYGQADPAIFDHANWRLCAIRALGQRDFAELSNDIGDQDDAQLIEFIVRHSLPRRGITARPEQVLITMGAQNALWLSAQVLLGSGRRAVLEDPCYPALSNVLRHCGCTMSPVPVDTQGLPPQAIPHSTDVIFVTPSHQCPTNATMPHARRRSLLARARDLNALIIEDDYEFEMAYLGSPEPALKSLDTDGRVIYVGSFSKSLFPGLRLGYLVGSEPFIEQARALRASVLRHPPGHIQRTIAYFLSLGHYDAQIRKMGEALAERRSVMRNAITQTGLHIAGASEMGGSSFWMRGPEHIDSAHLAKKLARQGVLIEPGQPFFSGISKPAHFFRLAYSSIPQTRIPTGVARIAEAISQLD